MNKILYILKYNPLRKKFLAINVPSPIFYMYRDTSIVKNKDFLSFCIGTLQKVKKSRQCSVKLHGKACGGFLEIFEMKQ